MRAGWARSGSAKHGASLNVPLDTAPFLTHRGSILMRTTLVFRRVGVASGQKVGAYLTRSDYARVSAVSETSDVPVAVLVRMALADALPRWEAALKRDRLDERGHRPVSDFPRTYAAVGGEALRAAERLGLLPPAQEAERRSGGSNP